jgi:hypothetical protein
MELDAPSIICGSKKCLYFIKNKLLSFLMLFYTLLLVLHKFLEPNKCLALKMDSGVCDSDPN